jgi:ABC-type transport system substrate-binding protein
LRTVEARHSGFRRLIFNVTEPPFNNKKMRDAVRYSLDIPQFLQLAFWGFGEPSRHWGTPRGNPWYVDLPEIRRDPSKVKQLLKEAGVGPNLEVVIIARRGEEEENQIIQEQMMSAGIKTRIEFLEHAPYITRRREGKFMMVLSGAEVVQDPAEAYGYRWGCDEVKKNEGRIGNYSFYCNEQFDRLLNEAAATLDQKKRYEVYAKAIRIIHDDVPEMPLVFVPRFFALNEKFRGFTTDGGGRFNWVTGGLSRMWAAR